MSIKNAPVVHNTGGFELKVTPPNIVAKMAGHNAGGFETRVSQEVGTH
jgi:hypothetical protein